MSVVWTPVKWQWIAVPKPPPLSKNEMEALERGLKGGDPGHLKIVYAPPEDTTEDKRR